MVDNLRRQVDRNKEIVIKNILIELMDKKQVQSPRSGNTASKKYNGEITDNKYFMFKNDGKVISMDSEMAKKGRATRNLNFSNIETLLRPEFTVNKHAESFRPEI
jgi:hypothetical protein